MEENIPLRFKTKKARELSLKLLNKIKKHLTLQDSTKHLEQFLPTTNRESIFQRQAWVSKAIHQTSSIPDISHVQELISQGATFSREVNKRHNNIVIAFGDEEEYDKYKSALGKKFYVILVQTEHDLLSISHYEQIRYVPSEQDLLASSIEELEQATILSKKFSLEDIAPEIYTDILEENKESLQAIKQVIHLLDEDIDIPIISTNKNSFQNVQDELDSILKQLQETVQSQISIAQFSGEQLVSIIQNNKQLIDKLPKVSQDIIISKKKELLHAIEKKYGLSCYQTIYIDHIGKVLLDEVEVERLQQSFLAKQQQDSSEHKQSIALRAKILIDKIDSILYKLFQLDLKIAISLFSKEFDLSFPVISEKGQSFVFGKNMNLLEPVPVEYYIGVEEKVAVITGANSGGKTTLLELLAQIQILTQMGLGVPAKEAKVSIVKELYYFSKNKGSANAGAFETLIKQFANIADDTISKLILADEIESVTEPDVAAKIIKGIIHHSQKNPNNVLVLVTHMGKELDKLDVKARFDGIEAKGLDKDFNLVVDRNPIIGRIARSTPQLIIERLAKKNEGEFYSYLHRLVTT